ncbi:uncharacterized protein LOC141639512 [Silene latifolia]|uniref:uncharacterized protein LOC141639512 n=1 Tax=Silene latifolia TaxID=37657 RepID=UPI003D778481
MEWNGKWDDFDKRLEKGMEEAINGESEEDYTRVNEEVRSFAKAIAIYWKQRAKLRWMVDGDTCIKGGDGSWIYDSDEVSKSFQNYFVTLFSVSQQAQENNIEGLLQNVSVKVVDDDVDMLRRNYTAKKVRRAVFQMGAMKSPGPDGIPAIFYQKCWHLIKKDFTKAVLSILNSGMVLREVNKTFIALIPKCDNPEEVKDYRPISLCNVFMRVVTKCITNRMTKIMGYLVGNFQNAFIAGRSITDNILLAHEAIFKINSQKKGKSGSFAFKADMSKAYDRVRWDFLQAVLYRFSFPENMIQLIMNCVSTVSYEVLFNGAPLKQFKPECGLRQGDPLLPYLFLLCMEVLSSNVISAQARGSLTGVKICRGVRPLTHLFFADDSVFFIRDKGNAATVLRGIIYQYCSASGQRLNEEKCGMLFSPNMTLRRVQRCLTTFNIKTNKGIRKYLGTRSGKSIHWCSKKFTSLPKKEGGLGIRNVECLNQALLSKHAWRIVSKENSLFTLTFREKIFGDSCWTSDIRPQRTNHTSWGVKSVLRGLQLILDNLSWQPGFSSSLNVWTNKWVNGQTPDPKGELLEQDFAFLKDLTIKDLQLNSGGWNHQFVQLLFTEETTNRILATVLRTNQTEDVPIWPSTQHGSYTVKSGYGMVFSAFFNRTASVRDMTRLNTRQKDFCGSRLWHLPGPRSWKILVWKILSNSLPVGEEFERRNIPWNTSCCLCQPFCEAIETVDHIFKDCEITARVWASSPLGVNTAQTRHISARDWIINWILYLRTLNEWEVQTTQFLAMIVSLWNLRNNARFRGERFVPEAFFRVYNPLVSDALNAVKESKTQVVQGSNDVTKYGQTDHAMDLITLRNGNPVYITGTFGSCSMIRLMVDASWRKSCHASWG